MQINATLNEKKIFVPFASVGRYRRLNASSCCPSVSFRSVENGKYKLPLRCSHEESGPASTAFKTLTKRKSDRISKDADELVNVLVEPAQKLAFNSLDQGGNLFDNAASNFTHVVAVPSPTIDNSRISSIDSLIDEKILPVFNNVNGTDRCSPMSSTSTHPFNSPCSSPDDAIPNPSLSFAITCDFCQEICVNKEVLKQHLMANHTAGYCTHYCSLCDFKDTNFRRMTEHARQEHKSTKCLKNCTPNDEQYDLLIKIKEKPFRKLGDFITKNFKGGLKHNVEIAAGAYVIRLREGLIQSLVDDLKGV
uniref:C2H2-type domain-containing protein n=1 Tax=Romanomermis culicivorax TaxID=13658 RepID=A0A915I512_ROMCU